MTSVTTQTGSVKLLLLSSVQIEREFELAAQRSWDALSVGAPRQEWIDAYIKRSMASEISSLRVQVKFLKEAYQSLPDRVEKLYKETM